MTGIRLHPIFDSFPLVAAIVLGLLAVLYFAPRRGGNVGRRQRTLALLRGALIAILGLAMLRPGIVTTAATPNTASLLVMFDQSRSMLQPSGGDQRSRWDAQEASLRSVENTLDDLPPGFVVHLYGYDRALESVSLNEGVIKLPKEPTGRETDIGSCLHDAVARERGQRIAGVIVLGDGAQTAIQPRVELQQVSRELSRLDCPLYTVAFGVTGDASQARDLAVESMPDRYRVFVKNELVVKAAIRARGFVNQAVPIELVVEDGSGGELVAGERRVTIHDDDQLLSVQVPFVPEQPGEYKLKLRVPAQPGELATQNNELTAFLTVLEGGLRVLYLYGDLLGEQLRLRRALDASPDIQLDDQFINPRNRGRWPVALAGKWQQPTPYDAVLIESVDVTAFADADSARIGELAERGTGIMMIGGYNSFGAGGFQRPPWSELLPIRMGRFERQDVDPGRPISRDLHLWNDLTLVPAEVHPVTLLRAGSENAAAWGALPPLSGANRITPKPSARVLLQSVAGDPILVAGQYGRGRVLAFAGNSTARWVQLGNAVEHRRFWRQSVLWLAQREDLTRRDVWVNLERRRAPLSTAISFTAGAVDGSGQPLPDVSLSVMLESPNGSSDQVQVTMDDDVHRGVVPPQLEAGDYTLRVIATQAGSEAGMSEARFQIVDRDLEMSDPAADFELLQRLADATRTAGGRAIAAEELPAVLEDLQQQFEIDSVEVESKWQLGDSAMDAWLVFCLALVLVTVEWVLRKRWGLV